MNTLRCGMATAPCSDQQGFTWLTLMTVIAVRDGLPTPWMECAS